METEKKEKYCPLSHVAVVEQVKPKFVTNTGLAICDEHCAWYIGGHCAMALAAMSLFHRSTHSGGMTKRHIEEYVSEGVGR